MWKAVATLPALLLGSCSPPHRFIVEGAGEAKGATLILRDKSSAMERHGDTFTAERVIGDASGAIRIHYNSGEDLDCRIGYITNGEPEPHVFIVRDNRCHGLGWLKSNDK